MTFELAIAITGTLCGTFGILTAWLTRANYRHCRESLECTGRQIESLENALAETRRMRADDEAKIKDQARRIAWLETRIRQPKALKEVVEKIEAVPEFPLFNEPASAPKSNITERRHRILTLASRGQNIETIASTLGMMTGEVQLVMNLNRSTASFV